jgi:hypothetical protein
MGESSDMGVDNTLELLCGKFQKIERLKKSYFGKSHYFLFLNHALRVADS